MAPDQLARWQPTPALDAQLDWKRKNTRQLDIVTNFCSLIILHLHLYILLYIIIYLMNLIYTMYMCTCKHNLWTYYIALYAWLHVHMYIVVKCSCMHVCTIVNTCTMHIILCMHVHVCVAEWLRAVVRACACVCAYIYAISFFGNV